MHVICTDMYANQGVDTDITEGCRKLLTYCNKNKALQNIKCELLNIDM